MSRAGALPPPWHTRPASRDADRRAALTSLPHLAPGWIALDSIGALGLFTLLGVRGFVRRAVD